MPLPKFPNIPGVRRASKKEIRELLKLPWVRDEALSDDSGEARILPDGRALHLLRLDRDGNVYIDEGANLYPSREALAQVVEWRREAEAQVRAGGGRFDPAKELLPPLDDFLRDVDTHAKSLGKVLHIPEEALDRSVESVDLVDKAVGRLRIAKRMTPEVFTPVTAYLGEVMRLVCDGRWARLPATIKKKRPEYDRAEYAAYATAEGAAVRAATAAAREAYASAKARGASEYAACQAREAARNDTLQRLGAPAPNPTGFVEYEEPLDGHEHEPVIRAHDGALVQPVVSVIRSLSERSTYGSLRVAVEGHLARYLIAKRKAGSSI